MSTWRVGNKLGRTLYIDGVCVGMVDRPEIAASIVEAMSLVADLRAQLAAVTKERDDSRRQEGAAVACLFDVITALGWTSETATPDDHAKIVAGVRAAVADRDAAKARVAELEPGLVGLMTKFYAEQERSIGMHRRAQRLEGDDAKARLAETREGWRREIAKAYKRAGHQIARTRIMGRALRDLLVFHGASDTYVDGAGKTQRHGYTCFMVADLAAQRDAALSVLRAVEHVWLPGMALHDRRCPVCRSPNDLSQPHEVGCVLAAALKVAT